MSAVDVASVSYANDEYEELRVVDLVDDAEVSDSNAVAFFDLKHLASGRARIVGEGVDDGAEPGVCFPVELPELPCGCGSIVNPIGHDAYPARP